MGLMDILNGIDLKDIAMGMAVASNGDTAVPAVLNILDKQRKEQEAKDQARNTSNFIQAIYASQGNDPTAQILAKQRTLNAMPDTTTQYDTSGIPAAQSGEPGSQEAAYNAMSGGGITTQDAPNLDKAKASIAFVQEATKARDSMPNVADAIAKIWPQFQDKNLDPQLVSSAFAHLYSVNEKKVEKLITIMDKQQAREDASKIKQEEFQNKITPLGKSGEWYSQGGIAKQNPGEAEPKTDAYNVAKRLVQSKNPGVPITEQMINDEMIATGAAMTGKKAEATELAKQVGGFTTWTPEAKNQAFMYNLITKEPPVSTRGMAAGDRKVYAKEYAQWQVDKDYRPGDIALMQADYRAGDMSLKNMAKQEAPMAAFVGNINKQIDKVAQLYNNNDRVGLRLIDLPIRELKVRAVGSGDEAVKASYLLEISNEIGKLSSGASGSVQQLSDSAKEDWKKVHDVNLPFSEIMKIVNATRDQANMRIQSWRDAKEEVRGSIQGIGTQTNNGGNNPGNIMKPGGESSGLRNYNSPEEGLIAIPHLLLTDKNYKGKTVDQAMRTYSNNGYGGEIVPDIQNKPVANLTAPEMTRVTQAIIKHEGNVKAQVNLPPAFGPQKPKTAADWLKSKGL
jgi:hypothetical protein